MPADPSTNSSTTARIFPFLLPLVALAACIPLFRQGCSCGHDIGFHLASWLDAAQQLRHGTLYPSWDYTAAWNAGEPRFLFYPPLSWMLGELLTLTLPFRFAPAIYTWLALSAAGLSMFSVTRRLTTPTAAFLLSALYLANPYMLFTALERTAFAELLSAAWIPLLLFALLRDRPTIPGIAIPLALLWLTNAPAAVMGSYSLAIVAAVRLYIAWRQKSPQSRVPHVSLYETWVRRMLGDFPKSQAITLALTYFLATLFGLTLPAVYLLPAAYERRFVEITMALVPGLSYPANFLFAHTGAPPHDAVLHQASCIAIALLALAFLALTALFFRRRETKAFAHAIAALGLLTLVIALLLIPISTPIWAHAPELAFLQFPWRWLMVLAPTLILLLALLMRPTNPRGVPSRPSRPPRQSFSYWFAPPTAIPLAFACAILLSFPLSHLFLQSCPATDQPATVAALFRSGHGIPPTDEYTPNHADNDFLRSDSPAFWLSDNPNAPAPNTTPNPNELAPDVDFGEPSPAHTLSHRPPAHFNIPAPHAEYLILNLRDFPNWDIGTGCPTCRFFNPLHRVQRDDGLIALAIPAGTWPITITWHTGRDRLLGALISFLSLAALIVLNRSHSQ